MEGLKPPQTPCLDSSNLSKTWKNWREEFALYVDLTMAEADDKQKVKLFSYLVGESGRELLNTLMGDTAKDAWKIEDIITKFDDHCDPSVNEIVERYRFFTRNQGASENTDSYVTELRLLAKTCNFGTLRDSLIRDRIVCGGSNTAIRERLLREKNLTLDTCLHLCRAAELSNGRNTPAQPLDEATATWSEETEEQLIELVEERPPLYNITLQCYSNRSKKDKLWREIESELGLSGKDLRSKWDNLRTTYNRYKKTVPSGSAPRTARQLWILSRLQFIEPHTKRKESTSNLTHKELCDDAAQTSTPGSSEDASMSTCKLELDIPAGSPVAESSTCESAFSNVLGFPSGGADQSQSTPAKRKRKGQGVPVEDEVLMNYVREALEKTATDDRISLFTGHLAARMRLLPEDRLIQIEYDIQSLVYKYSQPVTD